MSYYSFRYHRMQYHFVIALISFSLVNGFVINPFWGLPEDSPLQIKLNQLKAVLTADFYKKYPNLQPPETEMTQKRVVGENFVKPKTKKHAYLYVMRVI